MKKSLLFLCAILSFPMFSNAEITLSGIFGDNMVIQRNAPVKIWGRGDKNEIIEISLNGQTKKTRVKKDGTWEIILEKMVSGGPYTLIAKGKTNLIEFNNILIGDVWYCGGQSNMEWNVGKTDHAEKEIKEADYPEIRQFKIRKKVSSKPQEDLTGSWEVCSPETVGNFTAVGYYFARKLYQETDVPIGIMNISWGGTAIETWMRKDAYDDLSENIKTKPTDVNADFDEFYKENDRKRNAYFQALNEDIGNKEKWFAPATDYSSWKSMDVPGLWSKSELGEQAGYVWFNYEIDLPKEAESKTGKISLGAIIDQDVTWINGVHIGSTFIGNKRRIYEIPPGILKVGKNNITVRVYNYINDGGMVSTPETYWIKTDGPDGMEYTISGKWKYKETVLRRDFDFIDVNPSMASSLLYNGMVNPLIGFRIKGMIWYQGESNAGNAFAYRTLFPAMITDYRKLWGYDFPFYWVQLANYKAKDKNPGESEWAEVREAQTMTLALPHTGQAVIYDIGEAEDIHPRNKQDVGLRLALIALNKDYGKKDIVYSGPVYQSMEISENKIILTFDNIGTGLCTSDNHGYIRGFAIAGSDKKFVWAQAYIEDNKVVVSSKDVSRPVAVRYAWSDNPVADLYNKEGFLAVPFRTDKWKGLTEK